MEMLDEAREQIEFVEPAELAQQDLESEDVLLIDVRKDMERRGQDTIPGAHHVPRGILEWWTCSA